MIQAGIYLADGFEEVEGLSVVDLLRRAGINVMMISVMDKKEVTGSHKITVLADKLIEEVNPSELSIMIIPGGQTGTKNLETCDTLKKQLVEFNKKDKYIAAICAAPSVLGHLGILANKKATCYPGCEKELSGAMISTNKVVVDGNIITSRGMGTSIAFGLAIIQELIGVKAADEIAASIIY